MTRIILSDKTAYKLCEGEHYSFEQNGISVWSKGKGSEDKKPPKRFFSYNYVQEVRD